MITPGTRITFQLGIEGGTLYTDRTVCSGVVTDVDPTKTASYYVLADDGHKFLLTPAQIITEAATDTTRPITVGDRAEVNLPFGGMLARGEVVDIAHPTAILDLDNGGRVSVMVDDLRPAEDDAPMSDHSSQQAAPTNGGGFAASSHRHRPSQSYPDVQADDYAKPRLDVSTFAGSEWPDVAVFTARGEDGDVAVTIDREAAADLVHQLVSWLAAGR